MKGLLRSGVVGATAESFPLFRCPGCKQSGLIDEDQYYGRVSVECVCGWHVTRDWSETGGSLCQHPTS